MPVSPPTSSAFPRRAAGLAATTIVALVAMSAAMSAGPAPRAAASAGRVESHVVRAVAAAMVAAARDLLATDRLAVGTAAFVPATPGGDRHAAPAPAAQGDHVPDPAMGPGERRLDLPPPAC